MLVMKEIEVTGMKANILDAGCSQYRGKYVIPTDVRNGITVLKLDGFCDADVDIKGVYVMGLLAEGLLRQVSDGYEIMIKWHN